MSQDILGGTNIPPEQGANPGIPRLAPMGGAANRHLGVLMGANRRPRRNQLQNLKRICLWPKDCISIQTCWLRVTEVLRELAVHVKKIVRVDQTRRPHCLRRYDIFVSPEMFPDIWALLHLVRRRLKWYVKPHENYRRRQARRLRRNEEQEPEAEDEMGRIDQINGQLYPRIVKLSTWNIHSIADKRQELGLYLHDNAISILGIQETLRSVDKWPLNLGGFQIFESLYHPTEIGHRGLALCIRTQFVAEELGDISPFYIGAKVMLGSLEWTVVTVYIPPAGSASRSTALLEIKRLARKLTQADLSARVVFMGDWNMNPAKLNKLLARWRLPLQLVQCAGNSATYKSPGAWTSIDHFVASTEASLLIKHGRVNRRWDLSDHWPLESKLRVMGHEHPDAAEPQNQGLRLDIPKCQLVRDAIAHHNLWDALLEDETPLESVDTLAAHFEATTKAVAEETDVVRPAVAARESVSYRLTNNAKKAIRRRIQAYRVWMTHEAPSTDGPHWERYCELRVVALREKRVSSKLSWTQHIVRGALHLNAADLKSFWVWLKQLCRRGKSASTPSGPIYAADGSGNLIYDPGEKVAEWRKYYAELLSDPTTHSRNRQHWLRKFPGPDAPPTRASQ